MRDDPRKDAIKARDTDVCRAILDQHAIEVNATDHFKLRPEERTPSAHLRPGGGWYDFGSGDGGDCFDLIARLENLDRDFDFPQIMEIAERLLGHAPSTRNWQGQRGGRGVGGNAGGGKDGKGGAKKKPKEPIRRTERDLSFTELPAVYGLKWSSLRKWGARIGTETFLELIGHPEDPKVQPAILYPIRRVGHDTAVFKAKSLGRWNGKRLTSAYSCKGSGWQFGLMDCGLDSCRGLPLILTEGEEDAANAAEAGFAAASLPNGARALCPQQIQLIRDAGPSEVILAFDADVAGRGATADNFPILAEHHVPCRAIIWPKDAPQGHDLSAERRLKGVSALNALLNAAISPEAWLAAHAEDNTPSARSSSGPAPDIHEVWPPIKPLAPDPPTLDPSCLSVLNVEMRDILFAVSERSQVPIDGVVQVALCCLSALVLKGYAIKPYEDDPWEYPCLYSMLVMTAGGGKSYAYNFLRGPVDTHADNQFKWARNAYVDATAESEVLRKSITRLERAAAEDPQAMAEVKRLSRSFNDMLLIKPKRYLTSDATEQAIGVIMATNEGTCAIITEEGTAFNGVVGTYMDNNTTVGEVFTKGFTGESVSVSRVGREDLQIDKARMAIAIGCQPEIFTAMVRRNPQLKESGFFSRCLLSFHDIPPSQLESDRRKLTRLPESMRERWNNHLGAIASYYCQFKNPAITRFEDAAIDHLADLAERTNRARDTGGPYDHISSILARPAHQAQRIAALLHLLHHGPKADLIKVNADTTAAAVAIVQTSIDSWASIFRFTTPAHETATRIARLLASDPTPIALAEIRRRLRIDNNSPIAEAVAILEDHNIARTTTTPTKGRPQKTLHPNPKIKRAGDA